MMPPVGTVHSTAPVPPTGTGLVAAFTQVAPPTRLLTVSKGRRLPEVTGAGSANTVSTMEVKVRVSPCVSLTVVLLTRKWQV